MILGQASGAGQWLSQNGNFGATFSAPPTVHVIPIGGPVPAGCSGTATAPNAAAGHLCIFQTFLANTGALGICAPAAPGCGLVSDPWGFGVFSTALGAGTVQAAASWAARPIAIANPAFAESKPNPTAGEGKPLG